MIPRAATLIYGVACYAIFLATFLYAIGFVGNLAVPKSIDTGPERSRAQALVIDLALVGLFAVQHSVMARRWFKRAWARVVPIPVERSTYVLLASLLLLLLFWGWEPIGEVVWHVEHPAGRALLQALFWTGWFAVLVTSGLIDHGHLFGLRQVHHFFTGKPLEPPTFKTPAFYKMTRHPLYLGFLVAFWSTPRMTQGHLLFALMCTAYILVAIRFEERDLIHLYGDRYRRYREQVPMLLPLRFLRK
jgi:methanethiol S-methyltransferase